ncbi:unannotated protein [freshwater metagenome]|uniref:Unannotated protein n=1 Tax=freshwater metagenome TaxID=449393 RepID=A0A6J7IEV0_9ZZZZ|nr:EthD family reductase [Actinomycetota bacterium]
MYKVIWATKLNAEKTREEADRHWREIHAPLMSKVPGLERYVQNLWVEALDPSVPGPEQIHLHSEAWFTDEAAYLAAMGSPEWAAVAEDSPKCFDNSGLLGAVLEERVMFERGA